MFIKLLKWSNALHSNLPWRTDRSIYRTLVSEFMLQQTTVGAVLKHYERFLKEFPDIETLALTTEEEILIAWKGLGYYRRAKNLRKAAIDILSFYDGNIPKKYNELTHISGIGDYTASAILAIGYKEPMIAIDANIERVLSRIFNLKSEKGKKLHLEIKQTKSLQKYFEKFGGRELNESLMDLGRVFCKAKSTDCLNCPVQKNCLSFKRGKPLDLPYQREVKKQKMYQLDLLRIIVNEDDKLLVYKKSDKEWLAGQWELPTFVLFSENSKLKQYPLLDSKKFNSLSIKIKKKFSSSITKYKISNAVVRLEYADFCKLTGCFNEKEVDKKGYEFFNIESIKKHLSTTSSKALLI